MYLDALHPGGSADVTGTSDTIVGDVIDLTSAKKRFAGSGGRGPKAAVTISAVGGTSPTARVRLVGADDAALTTNPIILGDTGASRVLTAGDLPVNLEFVPAEQLDAKRYYGFVATLGGTSPTATITANLVETAQSAGFH